MTLGLFLEKCLRETGTKFPGAGGHVLYENHSDSSLPPAQGWIAVEGALPVFRIFGIDGLAEPTYV